MAEEINLKGNSDHKKKEMIRTLFGDDVDRERLEVMEGILSKSNVQFASISDKVSIDFTKFIQMCQTHNLAPLLDEYLRNKEKGEAPSDVVVSSALLADISNCEVADPDDLSSINVLTGIFIYGMLTGGIVAIGTAMILNMTNVVISIRDMILIMLVLVVLVLIPIILIKFEPYLQQLQTRNSEFFHRLVSFFSGNQRGK